MNEIIVKERIRQLLKQKGVSIYSLSKRFGVNQGTLTNQINGDTAISLTTILTILAFFPEVSCDWLLRGTGDMFGSQERIGYVNSHGAHHNNNTVYNSPGALAEGSSSEMYQKVEQLQAEIKKSDLIIKERDARIRALEEENSKLIEINHKLIMGK